MDSRVNLNKISSQELKSEFILVLCLRFDRQFFTNLKSAMLNPYAFSLAIKKSCERHSNAFDRSVRSAPKVFLLPIADFHFSNIGARKFWALNPCLNPHRYFVKMIQNIQTFV